MKVGKYYKVLDCFNPYITYNNSPKDTIVECINTDECDSYKFKIVDPCGKKLSKEMLNRKSWGMSIAYNKFEDVTIRYTRKLKLEKLNKL